MEMFLALLTGVQEAMPTAALAQISLPIHNWEELTTSTRGTLVNLWTPREVENNSKPH